MGFLGVRRKSMKKGLFAAALAAGTGLVGSSANAAVLYSTIGTPYQQNFDGLPNSPTNVSLGASPAGWTDDNAAPAVGNFSLPGWYLDHRTTATEGGFNGKQRFRNGSGSSGTGAFYSFGANSTTERAMGSIPASTLTPNGDSMRMGLRLTNNTGVTLDTVTVTFDGEQWNDAVSTSSMSFSYGINLPSATWHSVPSGATPGSVTFVGALGWTAPVTANPASPVAVNGNAAGKVAGITATITLPAGNLWTPGSDLWLRWSQIQVASTDDDGLAIDNLSVTATPEPASLGLLGLGAIGLLGRRRQK
jgi:hypothetical protein